MQVGGVRQCVTPVFRTSTKEHELLVATHHIPSNIVFQPRSSDSKDYLSLLKLRTQA